MTKKQENKLTMYLVVIQVCNANAAVWSALVAFVTSFGEFTGLVQSIEEVTEVQGQNITGVAMDKKNKKIAMVNIALAVGKATHAYATDENNEELAQKVNYSWSQLMHVRDTTSRDRCHVIYDEANAVIANLGDYGILAANMTALQNAIGDYAMMIPAPRTAVANRKSRTTELTGLFNSADKVLKRKMDKLIEQKKASFPQFYELYYNARIIVDSGSPGEPEPPVVGG